MDGVHGHMLKKQLIDNLLFGMKDNKTITQFLQSDCQQLDYKNLHFDFCSLIWNFTNKNE